jgi:prophage DNA circulation protein
MAWETDLQDASFRGVAFDIINTRDSMQRDIAQHEYPYRTGPILTTSAVNHAACSVRRSSLATTTKAGCRRLWRPLDTRSGELIHPVFGSMPDMLCYVYQVNHEAETPTTALLICSSCSQVWMSKFFVREWPLSQADAILTRLREFSITPPRCWITP